MLVERRLFSSGTLETLGTELSKTICLAGGTDTSGVVAFSNDTDCSGSAFGKGTIEGFGPKRVLEILAKNDNHQFFSKVPGFRQVALELNQETLPGYLFADFPYDSSEKRKRK